MTDTPTLLVADSNVGQVAAWDGGEGAYWATHAERYEDSTAAHRRRLLAALELRPDSRVLDVGCRTGQATREVAAIARSGSALGVDLSARMLDVARRRAAADDLTNSR